MVSPLAPLWHAPTSDSAQASYVTPLDNPTPLAQILEKLLWLVIFDVSEFYKNVSLHQHQSLLMVVASWLRGVRLPPLLTENFPQILFIVFQYAVFQVTDVEYQWICIDIGFFSNNSRFGDEKLANQL